MADKMTKREMFSATIDVLNHAAEIDSNLNVAPLVAGIEHEIVLLDRKRNSSSGKDAKRTAEQVAIMVKIAEVLSDNGEPMRATDITKRLNDGTAVQRVTALLRKMVDAGEVVREQDKKNVTFSLK